MSNRRYCASALVLSLCAMLLLPPVLSATSMIKYSEKDLAVDADIILQGRVTSTWTEWGENGRYIYTYGTVAVDKVVKGYVDGDEYVIKRPGGSIGSSMMEVPSAATFKTGDELILFLLDDQSYESNILGWEQGRFNVVNGSVVQNGKSVDDFIADIQSDILNDR